jgi:hypothetical protein
MSNFELAKLRAKRQCIHRRFDKPERLSADLGAPPASP